MILEGAVVHVSLEPSPSPSKCIANFAVGPPVLVEFSSDLAKQLPAFIMGKAPSLQAHAFIFAGPQLQLCNNGRPCCCINVVPPTLPALHVLHLTGL